LLRKISASTTSSIFSGDQTVSIPSCSSESSSVSTSGGGMPNTPAARTSSFFRVSPRPSALPVERQSSFTCCPQRRQSSAGPKNIDSSSGCAVTSRMLSTSRARRAAAQCHASGGREARAAACAAAAAHDVLLGWASIWAARAPLAREVLRRAPTDALRHDAEDEREHHAELKPQQQQEHAARGACQKLWLQRNTPRSSLARRTGAGLEKSGRCRIDGQTYDQVHRRRARDVLLPVGLRHGISIRRWQLHLVGHPAESGAWTDQHRAHRACVFFSLEKLASQVLDLVRGQSPDVHFCDWVQRVCCQPSLRSERV
jgi:hypothetical protein